MPPRSNQLLRIAIACSAAYGVLRTFPQTSDIAIVHILLLFAAVSTAIVAVILDSESRNLAASAVSIGVWCLLGFGIGYLPIWYLQDTYTNYPSTSATTEATALTVARRPIATPEPSIAAVETVAASLPTASPLPPSTPTPPSHCGQATVRDVDELAIRDRPGLRTQVIGTRPGGTVVDLLCDAPVEADGISWLRVRTDGVDGWMSSRYLK